MSRRAASFTQANVARALRAAEQVAPGRMTIEISPDGTIRILPLERAHEDGRPAAEDAPLAQDERIVL
jgi:hypothetical protein